MLEPQDFRDVLFLARERTLKGAARALGVDPATMGRRLEALEGRLGARVFLRARQGLEVTPEGEAVVATAERLDAVQREFERGQLARAQGGALTVTAAEWGVPLLTPLLLELAEAHPGLRLQLRIENRALDLAAREADLALRVGRPTEKALAGKRVGVVEYGLYASEAYLRRHPAPRTPAQLSAHALCTLDAGYARAPQVRWEQALAGGARTVLRTNSLLSLVEAARAGGGLATLPRALAERAPELRRVLPGSAAVQRDLWLVYHRDLRGAPALRPVVDALVARLRALFA